MCEPYKRFLQSRKRSRSHSHSFSSQLACSLLAAYCLELYRVLETNEELLAVFLAPITKWTNEVHALVSLFCEKCCKARLFQLADEFWSEGVTAFDHVISAVCCCCIGFVDL